MKSTLTRLLAMTLVLAITFSLSGCCLTWIPKPEPLDGGTESTVPADATTLGDENGNTGYVDDNGEYVDDPATPGNQGNGQQNGGNSNGSTTKQPSKGVVVGTTAATTKATTTAAPKNPLRVLSIGHSFSKDAMEKYLWDMLKSSGKYDYIVIAYLFYPGCSLDRQWDHITGRQGVDKDGNPYEYQQYRKTDPYTGEWKTCYKADNAKNLAATAIKDEDWDVITLQPSPDYGAGPVVCKGQDDYDNVGNIVNWINQNRTNKKGKIYYHMTWSFATDCRLWSFSYSNYNQMTMYKDFVNATKKYIFDAHPGKFAGIIPAGTSIQNARSSKLGDVFNMPGNYDSNADGYHLNDRGDCVAALTWYCVLTGKKAATATCPKEWKGEWDIFTEAVDAAVKTPYAVTQSSHK